MAHSQTARLGGERIARVIFEHASRIGREQTLTDLVLLNADLARDLTGAERCSLWLIDADTQELWTRVAHGTKELRIPSGKGLVGACIRDGQPILINDTSTDSRFFSKVDQSTGFRTRSVLCVPLRSDAGVIGALEVMNKTDGFDEEDGELLRMMGLYTASTIETERARQEAEAARSLQHELEIAGGVQRRLFPPNGKTADLEYVGLCRPAKAVGGDFYDFVNLDSGKLAVTLGDVSGKGFPAALLMAGIHTLMRSLLTHNGMRLAEIMEEINEAIIRNCSGEQYSTLFSGVIDPLSGQLRFVNCGHLPPMVLRARDGEISRPTEGNVPLGLMTSVSYQEHSITMLPGDLLICISDGIVEAQDREGTFWEDSLLQAVLSENRNNTPSLLAKCVVEAVDRFSGGAEQADDMTVIVIKRSTR